MNEDKNILDIEKDEGEIYDGTPIFDEAELQEPSDEEEAEEETEETDSYEDDDIGFDELKGDLSIEDEIMPDGTRNDKFVYVKNLRNILMPQRRSFFDIPKTVRNAALKQMGFALFLVLAMVIGTILSKEFVPYLIATIIIALLMVRSALIKIGTAQEDEILKFVGIIYSVDKVGLVKATRHYLVKISDGSRFLTIKTAMDKKIKVGLPITVYISKSEPIINTENGPTVETFISYSLSAEDASAPQEDDITIGDYMNGEEVDIAGYLAGSQNDETDNNQINPQ